MLSDKQGTAGRLEWTIRRLAAILAADVVGYSRLVGTDGPGTLALLAALRAEAVEPLLTAHGGRVFKSMDGGLLAEFPIRHLAADVVSYNRRLAPTSPALPDRAPAKATST